VVVVSFFLLIDVIFGLALYCLVLHRAKAGQGMRVRLCRFEVRPGKLSAGGFSDGCSNVRYRTTYQLIAQNVCHAPTSSGMTRRCFNRVPFSPSTTPELYLTGPDCQAPHVRANVDAAFSF
jgi:hypothetical protein